MYMIESKGGAIGCMLLSLVCLGTWPALLTLLERRGRLPQHTYLDYSITNFLIAILIALTLGEFGPSTVEKPDFITQLSQDNWPSVLFAMSGGIFLCLGNLACQYAFAYVGTTINYFLDGKINKAEILFPGVGCFLVAVFLGALVHHSNSEDNTVKLDKAAATETGFPVSEGSNKSPEKPRFGTASFLIDLENKRSIKVLGKNAFLGLILTIFAGICYSIFSPAFNLASNDQWNTLKPGVPHLTVYTAFFYFSLSCFVVAVTLNVWFLYRPALDLPKSSLNKYISNWEGRGWAMLAGIICGVGNGLQFMGGQAAGYAAADAVQALPLVSTFWGIVLFGEYRKSSSRTYTYLAGMLIMFAIAVGVLMASAGQRKH
ncbi:hypothetical protein Leryth_001578 [Lithospermum erythrorhizon]|nr:hypothetical protein Leryth_001578 [Lithospermum erythrorhizon]